jgi:hypothetical protein
MPGETPGSAESLLRPHGGERFEAFPHVNGALFAETLRPPAFTTKTREILLDACALDWSLISPAIFGALFQSIMDAKARRNLAFLFSRYQQLTSLLPAAGGAKPATKRATKRATEQATKQAKKAPAAPRAARNSEAGEADGG